MRASAAARPLQSRLLRGYASQLNVSTRAALSVAIAEGFAGGKTTAQITRELMRRPS